MPGLLQIFRERGFIEQTTHDQELEAYLSRGPATCYIGFDPTASSLHVGSLVPIMSLVHMQQHGHRPIALVGGGTGLVGDPSGKTEMRQLLTEEAVKENAKGLKRQLSRFLDFAEGKAMLLNNADWLTRLKYIPFLRDIGRHFSVNRMIRAESYKLRLDSAEGLSFIEFNYMVLQAYDFLELFDRHECRLQMGGNDQWGNIVAGVELIRRMRQETTFGMTFPLITTSSGEKMGKTVKGAVWLDPHRTSPYEYYQYWVNTDDRDVTRFLALFTLLPMAEIRALEGFQGAAVNVAKNILAFETTRLAHGRSAAIQAHQAAVSMFGQRDIAADVLASSTIPRGKVTAEDLSVPVLYMDAEALNAGLPAFKLFHLAGLASSGGAARRLIEQGGAYINGERVQSIDQMVTTQDLDSEEAIVLRSGKKRFHKVRVRSG